MSDESMRATARIAKGLPLAALAASAMAWIVLFVTTYSHAYNSSMTVGNGVTSILEFLGVWETMILAMMLPSSLGFLTLFQTVTCASRASILRSLALCLGYSLIWIGVGYLAIIVGETLYRLGNIDIWLSNHANVLAGSVLALAGCYQFSTLNRRCITICSHPANFFMRHYRRGIGNAFTLGLRYGLICLGCCWALMTAMVILGGNGLYLMMAVTVIMFAERALGWSDRFASTVGLTCVGLGVFVATSPDAIPAFAHNAANWAEMGSMQLAHHGWASWCHA